MRGIKHPLTNEIYEVSDDGANVIVEGNQDQEFLLLVESGFQEI